MEQKNLGQYLIKNKGIMFVAFVFKFIGTVSELFIPWLLAYLIDTVAPTKDIAKIVIFGGLMLLCALSAYLFNIWSNRTSAIATRNITGELRYDLFRRISYLSSQQIDRFTIPSVISRLSSNTYDVNQLLSVGQRMGVRAPILLLGGILMTLSLDAVLTLVLIATLPFIILVVWFISKKGVPIYSENYKKTDTLVRTVRENITGVRVIKALSKTEQEKRRFKEVNDDLSVGEKKASVLMSMTSPLMNLFLNLGLVAVLFVGAFRVNSGLTAEGKLIAFMTYFYLILNALIAITKIFVIYTKSVASSKRIFEVINTTVDLLISPPDLIETDAHIIFDKVNFSYLLQTNNLSDVSFQVGRGETLGIIGDTGSGKTTIINVLMRFYDIGSGTIRINGQNINSIPFESLYHKFGVVFQNDVLFSDTIKNNIDFYRGSEESELYSAARDAQADFITSYPEGMMRKIAIKGANLSGGQKQRLLIARALSKNAEILILDDSSSALDFKTDASLRRALKENYQTATKIIVAQRVSSIKHAQQILVIDNGIVAGLGSHEDLLKTCPHYREIYDLQTGVTGAASIAAQTEARDEN